MLRFYIIYNDFGGALFHRWLQFWDLAVKSSAAAASNQLVSRTKSYKKRAAMKNLIRINSVHLLWTEIQSWMSEKITKIHVCFELLSLRWILYDLIVFFFHSFIFQCFKKKFPIYNSNESHIIVFSWFSIQLRFVHHLTNLLWR